MEPDRNTIIIRVIISFLGSMSIAWRIIPVILDISRLRGLGENPVKRSSHDFTPTVTFGGIAMFASIFIAFAFSTVGFYLGTNNQFILVFGLSVMLFLAGLKSDVFAIAPLKALAIVSIAYGCLMYESGFISPIFNGLALFNFGRIIIPTFLTFVLLNFIHNSFALIDGIDGLFGGLVGQMGLVQSIILLYIGEYHFALLSISIFGSSIGFLRYNYSRKRKIFSGDSATYFIPFILIYISVFILQNYPRFEFLVYASFTLAIFDSIRVFGIRVLKGRSPFHADRLHFHHLLVDNGFSHLLTSIIILLANGIIIIASASKLIEFKILFLLLFIIYLILGKFLEERRFRMHRKHMLDNSGNFKFDKIKKKKKKVNEQVDMVNDIKLYNSLGFKGNPFITFSAEEELQFLEFVYHSPKYFNSLVEGISNGNSRFILGARGAGKTALVYKLMSTFSDNKSLCILIDDYSSIPLEKNESFILKLILEKLVGKISLILDVDKNRLKSLAKRDKIKLSFFIETFFKTIYKEEFERHANNISHFKNKNSWIRFFNFLIKPFNQALTLGVEVTSDLIKKSLGLENSDTSVVHKEYFKGFTLHTSKKRLVSDNWDEESLKNMLYDLTEIANICGIEKIIVFFDKVDENRRLKGNIENISKFLYEILNDTSLLLNKHFSLVFSLWNVLKIKLNSEGVRFDKIKPYDVTWTSDELIEMTENRLQYFGENYKKKELNHLFPDLENLEAVLNISDNSPRDFLRVLSMIYDEQSRKNSNARMFSLGAIELGMKRFIMEYDYYSIFPSQNLDSLDLAVSVRKVLSVGKTVFTQLDFANELGISDSFGMEILQNLISQRILRELPKLKDGLKVYEVRDPKLEWLIRNQLNPWKS